LSIIGRITIKLVLTGMLAFAAIILIGFAGFLFIAINQFGTDPINAGIAFVGLGIALLFIVFFMTVILKFLMKG
jgi:hypothetical protein